MKSFAKNINLLLIILLLAGNALAGEVVDKIVARVNDTLITQSDVNKTMAELEAQLKFVKDPSERAKKRTAFTSDIVNNMINQRVLEEEIKKANINITDDNVNRQLAQMAMEQRTTVDGLRKMAEAAGVNFENYKQGMKRDIARNEFLKKVIYPKISITDYDIDDYYKKHPSEFNGYNFLHFQEILLVPESSSNQAQLEKLAQDISDKLQHGGSFAEAAKKYSKGPFASNGGDSGLMSTTQVRSDLLNILLSMPIGLISDPIATPSGILILKVLEKKDPHPRPLAEVKNLVQQRAGEARVTEELENYIRQARSRMFVEIK